MQAVAVRLNLLARNTDVTPGYTDTKSSVHARQERRRHRQQRDPGRQLSPPQLQGAGAHAEHQPAQGSFVPMTRLKQFSHPWRRERGATLVIGMIMLVLLAAALFVIAAVDMSTMNLRVIGNTQARNSRSPPRSRRSSRWSPATSEEPAGGDDHRQRHGGWVQLMLGRDRRAGLPEFDSHRGHRARRDGRGQRRPLFRQHRRSDDEVVGSGGIGIRSNSYCSNTRSDVQATVTDQTGSKTRRWWSTRASRGVAAGDVTC